MTEAMRLISGVALAIAGVLKIFHHLTSVETLAVPGCFGSEFTIELGRAGGQMVHCWGCYAAFAGTVLIASAIVPKVLSNHNRARPLLSALTRQ